MQNKKEVILEAEIICKFSLYDVKLADNFFKSSSPPVPPSGFTKKLSAIYHLNYKQSQH